jgi:hypothetical protein
LIDCHNYTIIAVCTCVRVWFVNKFISSFLSYSSFLLLLLQCPMIVLMNYDDSSKHYSLLMLRQKWTQSVVLHTKVLGHLRRRELLHSIIPIGVYGAKNLLDNVHLEHEHFIFFVCAYVACVFVLFPLLPPSYNMKKRWSTEKNKSEIHISIVDIAGCVLD